MSNIVKSVESNIRFLRGEKVLLDADLAALYGVEVKVLNQAVRRNLERFPADFMFQLSGEEAESLRSQSVTSKGRGGRRYSPYAFTEQGVAMLSSVLKSPQAIQVNIEIMRTFVQMRRLMTEHADLSRKLSTLERKYDTKFKMVFDAIRDLMAPTVKPARRIGFKRE
jgi:hypothetical protein